MQLSKACNNRKRKKNVAFASRKSRPLDEPSSVSKFRFRVQRTRTTGHYRISR